MSEINKNPVVLLLVDGFGLSSSWQGNAIASASPKNFNEYWDNYSHMVLHSKPDMNISRNYTRISAGDYHISNSTSGDVIHDALSQSHELTAAIDTVKRNNASVNLIGVISKNDATKSISDLIKSIILCKKNLINNIYVHILIDHTFTSITEIGSALFELDQKLVRFDAQISTIVGLDSLIDKNMDKNIESIFTRTGQTFFSSRQCIAKHQKIARPSLIPLSLLEIKGNNSINDFDLIYFFSSPTDKFTVFIERLLLINKTRSLPRKLMSLQFFCLHDYPFNFSDGLTVISKHNTDNFIPVRLAKAKKKHCLITDSQNIAALNYYYLGNGSVAEQFIIPVEDSNKMPSTTSEILEKAASIISEKKYDFITINLPSLYRAYSANLFSGCVSEIALIDQCLPRLFELVGDGYLLISSAFGGAESMVANASNIGDNSKKKLAFESLPLVLVSNKTIKRTKSDLLHEILCSHEDLTFVHKVLEKLIF